MNGGQNNPGTVRITVTPKTFELFGFGASTAIALTINKVIIDTVTNKLFTASFTYKSKTES